MPRTNKSQKGSNNGNYKHGGKHSKLYHIWCSMRYRCNNKNLTSYINYGARGIKVCEEWDKDFSNFREWALKNGYIEGLSIDRIDVNGNYEPSNCQWITIDKQCDNKTNTIRIEYKGETKTLKQWSEILEIPRMTLYHRIFKLGWNIERAFKECVNLNRYDRKLKEIEGK
jgi:hypothetical protein